MNSNRLMKSLITSAMVSTFSMQPAEAKIKDSTCALKVIQSYDRTYEGYPYVDEAMLDLFRDKKLANFKYVELVDSIANDEGEEGQEVFLDLFNYNPDKANLEAITQNLDSGDYFALINTSCSKTRGDYRRDYLTVKDDKFKWVYKCKLQLKLGQFTYDDETDRTRTEILEDSKVKKIKAKVKDELAVEYTAKREELREEERSLDRGYRKGHYDFEEYQNLKRELRVQGKEEFFDAIRRDNLDEMKEEYRKALERILKKNKFKCKEI